jgi:hypothetical protein
LYKSWVLIEALGALLKKIIKGKAEIAIREQIV